MVEKYMSERSITRTNNISKKWWLFIMWSRYFVFFFCSLFSLAKINWKLLEEWIWSSRVHYADTCSNILSFLESLANAVKIMRDSEHDFESKMSIFSCRPHKQDNGIQMQVLNAESNMQGSQSCKPKKSYLHVKQWETYQVGRQHLDGLVPRKDCRRRT